MEPGTVHQVPIEAETIMPTFSFGTELPPKYFYRCATTDQIRQRVPASLKPQHSYCIDCQAEVMTKVRKVKGKGNISTCVCMVLMGCCCLSWVGLISEQFMDSVHECPLCGCHLGRVSFLNEQ